MPANQLVSNRQIEILVDYLEANRGFAVGHLTNSGPLTKQEVSRRWEELAVTLNAVAVGVTKSAVKWRDYWNEKKNAIWRKASKLRQHAQGAGGGPAKGKLTDLEERILAILGKAAVHGNPSVRIPFEENTPAQPLSQGTQTAAPLMETASPVTLTDPACSSTSELSTPFEHAPVQGLPIRLSPPSASAVGSHASPSPCPYAQPAASSVADIPHIATVPQWALQIEERRVAAEERKTQAMERQAQAMEIMSSVLTEMQKTMADCNRSIVHIKEILEANQPSLQ